ncbi:hypothetical protein [Pseudomonas psychrophila]|uniref:hypothetical protein n=1 Tax=Pseudomonas psychrophila TaxID=122355 RepID=UPI0002E4D39D|nr:hypothetical protein [Pseudomonas psychrophila]
MLSISHPSVMRKVNEILIGLFPVTVKGDYIPKLIVKASKETILTAKVRREFLIHLAPYEVGQLKSVGFIATFFDDQNHPLTVAGALIKEFSGRELSKLFISPQVDVHFFDELGRELLAYRAEFSSTKAHREMLRRAVVPSFQGLNQSAILTQLTEWFMLSTPEDDCRAIKVSLTEPLMLEDIVYIDMRPENHSYHGSPGYSMFTLEREVPGPAQEKEIIALLERTFDSESIYLGPKRTYDKEEVVDVLVVTDESVILIQAKDSQNLESTINKTLEKKRSATNKALKKAVGQVKGAIGYIRKYSPFVVIMDGAEVEISLEGKKIYSLVVMKELFDDEYRDYTNLMLELFKQTGISCIPLSYGELHQYSRFIHGDKAFFEAFTRVFNHGLESGEFPRLRVLPPGSIVNDQNV